MDALSDVLRAIRLTGAVFFDVQAAEPWVAETPRSAAVRGRVFPEAEHMMAFHVIARGQAWASCDGEPSAHLDAGDVVLFPHGDQHALASEPGVRDLPNFEPFAHADGGRPFGISIGSSPLASTQLVCGYLACDVRPFNPLLEALPRIVVVSGAAGGAIAALASFATAESRDGRAGSAAVLGRLSELMFVDVVRTYLESLPEGQRGWLAALREPFVSRALAAIHHNPARAWTLEVLAREIGLSRSALAERFNDIVGEPPMQYLSKWRMQLAATQLMTGADNLATVAERVGYESEAAFSRAFKKVTGVPPGEWRKQKRTAGES